MVITKNGDFIAILPFTITAGFSIISITHTLIYVHKRHI